MSDSMPYNPLDKGNLGASVAEALLGRRVHPLGELRRFEGAGIYAIYYTGSFAAYSAIAKRNLENRFEAPIYVGKAIPKGGRKGGKQSEGTSGALFTRLGDHRDSVRAAANLSLDDFYCRFLVVDDIWIPLGESLLIAKFSPIWNTLVDGFGNHDPGKGRYEGMRPRWDVIHPGRDWAERCKPRPETKEQILGDIKTYLRTTAPPKSPHFLAEQTRAEYKVD